MDDRPTNIHIRHALNRGVCPWCGAPLKDPGAETCPACQHSLRSAHGPRDAGSPGIARVCSVLALLLIIAVAVIQQNVTSAIAPKPTTPAAAGGKAAEVPKPSGQFEIMAKLFVKMHAAYPDPAMKAELATQAIKTLDAPGAEPADQLRVAMIAGELKGDDDALARLDRLKLEENSPLAADSSLLRALYKGEPLDAEGEKQLVAHHGWVGKLAATHGKPNTDLERAALVGGGMAVIGLMVGALIAVGLVLIVGFVLLILAIVRASSGRLRARFVPPSPGGSIPIETVVVFVLGFLGLKGLSAWAEQRLPAEQVIWFSLIAQWCLLLILLWPRLRGAKGGLKALGWHTGRGITTEIGCGIVGYLACLPLLVGGALISVTLMLLYQLIKAILGGPPPPPPENPLFEIASGKGGMWVVVVVYFLASVWAPIVEETIFRGALYRHLRANWTWFPAALVSALAFGFMHNYPVLMLGPVISLGFGFALMREWRGSLIASMTAHCIHNAVVLGVVLFAVYLIG